MGPKDRDRTERENAESEDESRGIVSRIGSFLKGEGDEAQATSMLRKDHEKVRSIFRKWEDAEDDKVLRAQLVQQASRELTVHAEIEEKIFYPAVRDAGRRDPEKLVRESYEEHKIVKTLIEELAGMTPSDPQFEAKFTVLKELVEHHADEEENDLFPQVEDLFSQEKLESLGAEMEDFKEELMESKEVEAKPAKRSASAPKTGKRTPGKSGRGGHDRARP
jgi:hemerythrin superfamily protein